MSDKTFIAFTVLAFVLLILLTAYLGGELVVRLVQGE